MTIGVSDHVATASEVDGIIKQQQQTFTDHLLGIDNKS